MNSYKTPAGPASARIVEKKSEFLAHLSPAAGEEEALAFLEEVRAQHRTANHNVYAYRLREGARQRYSDDGEPAKTAGLPVLNVLEGADITDCILVVTRYFGGTLLGTGGLVRAYTAAAQAALAAAQICTVQRCVTLRMTVPYPLYERVARILEGGGAALAEPEFTDQVALAATLPAGQELALIPKLEEICRGAACVEVSEPFYQPF